MSARDPPIVTAAAFMPSARVTFEPYPAHLSFSIFEIIVPVPFTSAAAAAVDS
jgi:hypothetical protein